MLISGTHPQPGSEHSYARRSLSLGALRALLEAGPCAADS